MAFKQVIEVYELLETPKIVKKEILGFFMEKGAEESELEMHKVKEEKGETENSVWSRMRMER